MFKEIYPGMKAYVKEQLSNNKPQKEIFEEIVDKFDYKGSRQNLSNYIYKLRKKERRDNQGQHYLKQGKIIEQGLSRK